MEKIGKQEENNLFCLCGLGNPGPKYASNRHNIGFIIIDFLAKYFSYSAFSKKFSGEFSYRNIGEKNVILFKPLTYMNNSGSPLSQLVNFYKIPLSNVIVFHDEADLDFARIKIKCGGGNAGHNGLKSIDQFLGKDYWRLRFGVGRDKEERLSLGDHVLTDFLKTEMATIEEILKNIANNIELLLDMDKIIDKELFVKALCMQS